jgi:hypothetical protein
MSVEYRYGGKSVVVTPVPKTDQPEVWDVAIRIDGRPHFLTAFGSHPPKFFPSPEAAVEYGKQAAEYVIDNPTSATIPVNPPK